MNSAPPITTMQDRSGPNQPDFLLTNTKPPVDGSAATKQPQIKLSTQTWTIPLSFKTRGDSQKNWRKGTILFNYNDQNPHPGPTATLWDIENLREIFIDCTKLKIERELQKRLSGRKRYYDNAMELWFTSMDDIRERLSIAGVCEGMATPLTQRGVSMQDFTMLSGDRARTVGMAHHGACIATNIFDEEKNILGGQMLGFIIKPVAIADLPQYYNQMRTFLNDMNTKISAYNGSKSNSADHIEQYDVETFTVWDVIPYTNLHELPRRKTVDFACKTKWVFKNGNFHPIKNPNFLKQPELTSRSYKEFQYDTSGNPVSATIKDGIFIKFGFATQTCPTLKLAPIAPENKMGLIHSSVHEMAQKPPLQYYVNVRTIQ